MKTLFLTIGAVAGIVTAAAAQTGGMADTIHGRQARYKQMGGAMKGISDQLHAGAPSIPAIQQSSRLLVTYAPQLLRWFPRGSGEEAGVRTRARAEIWSDALGFRHAGATLLVAVRTLNDAARRGDIDAVRAAMPQVAHACSGCHDDYRAAEH